MAMEGAWLVLLALVGPWHEKMMDDDDGGDESFHVAGYEIVGGKSDEYELTY